MCSFFVNYFMFPPIDRVNNSLLYADVFFLIVFCQCFFFGKRDFVVKRCCKMVHKNTSSSACSNFCPFFLVQHGAKYHLLLISLPFCLFCERQDFFECFNFCIIFHLFDDGILFLAFFTIFGMYQFLDHFYLICVRHTHKNQSVEEW